MLELKLKKNVLLKTKVCEKQIDLKLPKDTTSYIRKSQKKAEI